jgi:hypothetical protein
MMIPGTVTTMASTGNPNALGDYWQGIHKALNGRLESVREYLRHPSSGMNAENYFRDLLRQYLPRRYAIESGFVVNAKGDRSSLIDILIVDALNIPPLSVEPHFKIFPAEAVVGAVEITSAPKTLVKGSSAKTKISKLQEDIQKLADLRGIAREREYLDYGAIQVAEEQRLEKRRIVYTLSPRCFLVTFGDEWAKSATFEKHLLAALNAAMQNSNQVWLNAVFSMRHGMFSFRPHTPFSYHRVADNPLLEFFLFINDAVSGLWTSQIDLRRYRPTLPPGSEEGPVVKRSTS